MVRIPGRNFEVGRYEVTFAQWDACVAGGGCNGYRPNDEGWGRGNRPVINVSWNDAQAYVQWLSQSTGQRYRLLNAAEWEYAARAGTTTNFWWGDQDPVCDPGARNGAQSYSCTPNRTLPVGSFQPNGFGLYDVHGNVYEWVEDCHDGSCSSRVLRGGAWFVAPQGLRLAFRNWNLPTYRFNSIGFRVARTV
jgi:formylglycine-generating enzyme required for sulfatase activity